MFEYNCFDEFGNSISCLWQWDTNRNIKVDISNILYSGSLTANVYTAHAEESVGAKSSVNNGIMTIVIPNRLLMESCKLHFCINETSGQSQRTLAYFELPIRKRNMPPNYISPDDSEDEQFLLDIATRKEVESYLGI